MNVTPAAPTSGIELRLVAPTALVVAANIRDEAEDTITEDFLASITEHGVLHPVRAVEVNGELQVRDGQRRTLAARQAHLEAIPVVVDSSHESTDTETVSRIIEQWVSNEHRAGLTARQRVAAVEQLHLAGMSQAKIAKAVRIPRQAVKNSLTAAAAPAALQALDSQPEMTLEQAALVAEYEAADDAASVEALLACVEQQGNWQFATRQVAHRAAVRVAHARQAADLADKGIAATTERPDLEQWISLGSLVTADQNVPAADDLPGASLLAFTYDRGWVDEIAIHVAYFVRRADCERLGLTLRQSRTYVDANANREAGGDAEEMKAQRRRTIALNKLSLIAQEVRREHLTTVFARKTLPKGKAAEVAAFITRTMWTHHELFGMSRQDANTQAIAREILGGDPTELLLEAATAERAQVIQLGVAVAAHEATCYREAWQGREQGWRVNNRPEYLEFLQTVLDYTLTDIEQVMAGERVAEDVNID